MNQIVAYIETIITFEVLQCLYSCIFFTITVDLSEHVCCSYLHGYIIYIHIKLIEPHNKIKSDTIDCFVAITFLFAAALFFYMI